VAALAGVAAAGTAAGLASTARLGRHGMVIPALHDAASDRPVPYSPACGHAAGIPVCIHPAYRRYLPDLTAALGPAISELAGLPGAPVRAAQVPGIYSAGEGGNGTRQTTTISGHPPVLHLMLDTLATLPGSVGFTSGAESTAQFAGQIRLLALHAFAGIGSGAGTLAQQAIQAALLQGSGVPFAAQPTVLAIAGVPSSGPGGPQGPGPAAGPLYAAARRFAALPAPIRHAWLVSHLAGLRSGRLTLADLP
jgi:hypothetical protein